MKKRSERDPADASQAMKAIRAVISRTTPADYDGHTGFARMSAAERLAWLDHAVLFIESRRQNDRTWMVAESRPPKST